MKNRDKPFILYDRRDGRIEMAATLGTVDEELFPPGLYAVMDFDGDVLATRGKKVCLKTGEPLPMEHIPVRRPLYGVADGVSEVSIPVPKGTVCDLTDVIDDGVLDITFDAPGEYTFNLRHPAYLTTTITIEVKEP